MVASLTDIQLTTIDGNAATLGDYSGKVCLVVNVASKCGLTPQYEGLEALHRRLQSKNFTVLGFPANDFGGQEPGTHDEIKDFCSTNYDVTFPLFAKNNVSGDDKQPLYAALTEAAPTTTNSDKEMRDKLAGFGMTPNPAPEILWNFEKFVVGKDGNVVARFSPDVKPDDPALGAAIEGALGG